MPVTYNIVYQLYFNTKILRNIRRKHKTIAHLLLQNEKKKRKKRNYQTRLKRVRGPQEIHLLKGEINREHLALMNTWRGDCATGEEDVVEQMISQLTRGEGNGTPLQYSCLENPMDGGA